MGEMEKDKMSKSIKGWVMELEEKRDGDGLHCNPCRLGEEVQCLNRD